MGVSEGRMEEGGGVRGCKVSRRGVRGYQAAVCVHVDLPVGPLCRCDATVARPVAIGTVTEPLGAP